MCGFVALWRPRSGGVVREEEMRALLPWIRHRGPDQEGVFTCGGFGLAAARLRIRGGTEGDQPIVSADRSVALAFNGELLFQGCGVRVPRVGCDALALLPAEANRIPPGNMYAYVRWERDALRLTGGCDRLGIKPVVHGTANDGSIWHASEMRVIQVAAREFRTPNRAGLAELLHFHRPRHHLPFEGFQTQSLADSQPEPGFREAPSSEADANTPRIVRDAWRQAASAAASVEGPVSLLLSGGLDSSAVAAWSGREDLLCLTGRFEPHGGRFDESGAAEAVARHCVRPHEIVDLEDEDLVGDLPEVVRALEMPIAGPGSLALWRMAKRARAHGKVVLTGTGGDELFGGYARTALALGKAGAWTRGYEPLRSRIEAAGGDPQARLRAAFDRSADLEPLLHPDFAAMLGPVEEPRVRPGASLLDALLEEEREGTLRSLLHVEDRVSMAHGLESRPVACLGALPSLARRLPESWLVGPDGEGKRALRAALKGHIPETVRTDPRKRGFPTPFARAARGAGRERVQDWLRERRFRERGWWNVDACLRLLEEVRPEHDRALFALLCWEWWARWFLDGDAFDVASEGRST